MVCFGGQIGIWCPLEVPFAAVEGNRISQMHLDYDLPGGVCYSNSDRNIYLDNQITLEVE